MNVHKNARLTPRGRERIVRQVASGQTPEAVAEAAGSARARFASGLSAIGTRVWRDYRIAHPGRIGCTSRRLAHKEPFRKAIHPLRFEQERPNHHGSARG